MRTSFILVMIVGALAGCQSSSGGTASLNASYSATEGCSYYDYSNTGPGVCLGRNWH